MTEHGFCHRVTCLTSRREANDDPPTDQDATLPQTLRFVQLLIDTILDDRLRAGYPLTAPSERPRTM